MSTVIAAFRAANHCTIHAAQCTTKRTTVSVPVFSAHDAAELATLNISIGPTKQAAKFPTEQRPQCAALSTAQQAALDGAVESTEPSAYHAAFMQAQLPALFSAKFKAVNSTECAAKRTTKCEAFESAIYAANCAAVK